MSERTVEPCFKVQKEPPAGGGHKQVVHTSLSTVISMLAPHGHEEQLEELFLLKHGSFAGQLQTQTYVYKKFLKTKMIWDP